MRHVLTLEKMQQKWAPTGRVLIPFLGATGHAAWPTGRWDIWAPVFSWNLLGRRLPTLWIELHQRRHWQQRKSWRRNYQHWLSTYRRRPILMQQKFKAVPASIRYPQELARALVPHAPFHGTFDWLMALAMTLEVKEIAVWGVDYDSAHEEIYQKVGANFWIGVARGRNIDVRISPGSSLMRNPMPQTHTYGYDYPPWPKGHHPDDWPASSLMTPR